MALARARCLISHGALLFAGGQRVWMALARAQRSRSLGALLLARKGEVWAVWEAGPVVEGLPNSERIPRWHTRWRNLMGTRHQEHQGTAVNWPNTLKQEVALRIEWLWKNVSQEQAGLNIPKSLVSLTLFQSVMYSLKKTHGRSSTNQHPVLRQPHQNMFGRHA